MTVPSVEDLREAWMAPRPLPRPRAAPGKQPLT